MPGPEISTPERGDRRGSIAAATVAVALLAVGVIVLILGLRGHDGPPQPATARTSAGTTSAPASPTARTGAAAAPTPASRIGTFLPASAPTRIDIPSIGLQSRTFVSLHIQADGTLSAPRDANEVGLHTGGPTPGQLGPAVLAAHVDTPDGRRGIFYNLGDVKPGALIVIGRRDGSQASFTVDRVSAHRRDAFPTDLVYRGTFTRPEIRLVTCGGPTNSANEYRDNIIVFGHLTSAT